MEKLVGREKEIKELDRLLHSDRSELIIVYGRRRIGKTFLVRQFFAERFTFYYTGAHHKSQKEQLDNFANALQRYSNSSLKPFLPNWNEAFRQLQALIEARPQKERKVIFIDEMPWIDTQHSKFIVALEDFWNSWASLRDDICFIACGSSTSWMINKLIKNKGGLHNRITGQIYLRPFNLHECEYYLSGRHFTWDRFTITQCYMTFGGVPYYLSLLNNQFSLAQNIDNLLFSKNARLNDEFQELFDTLFVQADKYASVVRTLAQKKEGMLRSELSDATGLSGGTFSRILENLERCDFIVSFQKMGHNTKEATFQLSDPFLLFYFQFIEGKKTHDEHFWSHSLSTPKIYPWQGYGFEVVCRLHLNQVKKALGISGIATAITSWRTRPKNAHEGAQIDLLIDRSDRVINICEIKFSESEYTINKDYSEKLRNRIGIFKMESKTRKGIALTFITTYGLKANLYSNMVQSQVMLDDLFQT